MSKIRNKSLYVEKKKVRTWPATMNVLRTYFGSTTMSSIFMTYSVFKYFLSLCVVFRAAQALLDTTRNNARKQKNTEGQFVHDHLRRRRARKPQRATGIIRWAHKSSTCDWTHEELERTISMVSLRSSCAHFNTISVGFLTNSVERSRVCKWWVGLEWASKGFCQGTGVNTSILVPSKFSACLAGRRGAGA